MHYFPNPSERAHKNAFSILLERIHELRECASDTRLLFLLILEQRIARVIDKVERLNSQITSLEQKIGIHKSNYKDDREAIEEFTREASNDYTLFQLGANETECIYGRYKCGIYLDCLDWIVDPSAKTRTIPEPERTPNLSDNTWLDFMVGFLQQRARNTAERLEYIAERGRIASDAVSNLVDHEILFFQKCAKTSPTVLDDFGTCRQP